MGEQEALKRTRTSMGWRLTGWRGLSPWEGLALIIVIEYNDFIIQHKAPYHAHIVILASAAEGVSSDQGLEVPCSSLSSHVLCSASTDPKPASMYAEIFLRLL